MIVKAGTDFGTRNTVVNYDGTEINNVTEYDTETKIATIYLINNKHQMIVDENKSPSLFKIHLPLSKIISIDDLKK